MLEVRNLTKVYNPKKGVPVRALDNVNMKFEETGMVFVLGKSGSGKSTFLNLIGGLDSKTSGDIIIKGKSSADFSQSDFDSYRNTFIGFIFQEYNILNEFSVGKNIALALELQGKKSDKEAVEKILEQVDLAGYSQRRVTELSGGQKQRIAIARALIKDPEIIMADEPTGALDSNTGKQVFETLQKLSKTKLVIIVSHDRDYAEFYGDRVIEFADGKVISDIKKYKAQGEAIGDGVSIVDDSVLHVKKGHKLSDAEKKKVLAFLDNADGDLILSKDEKSNKDFRRFARIDDDGNKESFENVDPSKQNVKAYDPKEFKLIRSRLPLKHSIKIAGSSLKTKPVRLIFTILLALIAFAMFGLADTLGAYNKYNAMYESMHEQGIDYVSYGLNSSIKFKDGGTGRAEDLMLGASDVAKIQSAFASTQFDMLKYPGTYSEYSSKLSYSMNIYGYNKDAEKVGPYYTHAGGYKGGTPMSFGGIIEIENSGVSGSEANGNLTYRGYRITGKLPNNNREALISKHVFDAIKDLSYFDYKGWYLDGERPTRKDNFKSTITNEQAFFSLNKPFYIGEASSYGSGLSNPDGWIPFKIVGIIDTGFPTTYDNMKTISESQGAASAIADMMLRVPEIFALFNYGYHGALFSVAGTTQDIALSIGTPSPYVKPSDFGFSVSLNKSGSSTWSDYIATPENFVSNGGNITPIFADPFKTTLGANEILISINNTYLLGSSSFNAYSWQQSEEGKAAIVAKAKSFGFNEATFVTALEEYLLRLVEKNYIYFSVPSDISDPDYNFVTATAEQAIKEMIRRSSSAPANCSSPEWVYVDGEWGVYCYNSDTWDCVPFDFNTADGSPLKWAAQYWQYNDNGTSVVLTDPEEIYLNLLLNIYDFNGMNYYDSDYEPFSPFGVTGREVIEIASARAMIEYYFDATYKSTGWTANINPNSGRGGGKSVAMNIVGFYVSDDSSFYGFVAGSALTDALIPDEIKDIRCVITKAPTQKSALMEMIKFSYNETSGGQVDGGEIVNRYSLKNSVAETLDSLNETIEILAKVFLYVGLGFAVFAAFLLLNFIMVSISYKKREIGILRAIGARGSDVFGIFFLESLMIALMACVLALIACGIVAGVLNNVMVSQLGFVIKLFSFSIRQVGLVLGVGIGVALISTFLPVYNVSRKKPIEAIRKA